MSDSCFKLQHLSNFHPFKKWTISLIATDCFLLCSFFSQFYHYLVAQTNSLLASLSEFVDFFIKPHVVTLPAYIRHSTDFINNISCLTDLSDDTLLVTLDIASLYTNILHDSILDDIFCLYQGDADELHDYFTLLNSFNSNLKFTMDYSEEKVHFLDMWVMKNKGTLSTTL